jgi:hypothetical protein
MNRPQPPFDVFDLTINWAGTVIQCADGLGGVSGHAAFRPAASTLAPASDDDRVASAADAPQARTATTTSEAENDRAGGRITASRPSPSPH